MLPIALQVYSLREDARKDLNAVLGKIKAMGYDGVELAGFYGHAPARVKEMLDTHGLKPLSAHVPFVEMLAHPEQVLADYAGIGCEYVAIPYLTEEFRPGRERFYEVIEGARLLGETANRLGMTLLYHNHDFEFEKLDGKYALDLLYESVPPELLQTEIDTCWVRVAGEDPAAYVRRYRGRAPVVHLKDFVKTGEAGKMYGLIGLEEQKEQGAIGRGSFEFRPIGYGVQDIPAILSAAQDAGARWLVVEQDAPSMDKTAMECAEMSIGYLKYL